MTASMVVFDVRLSLDEFLAEGSCPEDVGACE
jgi:hypothetical protein